MPWLSLAAAIAILAAASLCAKAASGPIGVSRNGRYFVTAQGEPFYFLADTQWELFRRYSIADARMILENRKAKGFTVVMPMLTGVGDGTGPNLDGEHPWLRDDPATPNPAFFANVDAVVALARTNDLQLLIGLYHQTYDRRMTVENAKAWAAWVTARYHATEYHLDHVPQGNGCLRTNRPPTRRGNSGRRPRQTPGLDPSRSITGQFQFHACGALARLQLNDSWRVKPRWRAALDDPGARQMAILSKVMTGLPDWWTLVPDQSVLSAGGNTNGDALNLGARSAAGKWILAYIAGQPDITLNLAAITAAGSASVKWIDPATGSQEVVGTYAVAGLRAFRKPAGWQDAVLVATAEVLQASPLEPSPASLAQTKAVAAQGPLRVHPANPRYFADGSGRAILLTGSHTWGNFQDYRYVTLPSPPPIDFGAYLAFLHAHHHNCFRLWTWETAFNPNAKQGTTFFDPMPYERPGPGEALDGKPKFDLTRCNPAYFDRLRARVKAARDSGIYVSVMLFNGFSIEGKGNDGGDPWQGHPFNPRNNVNAIDGGGSRAVHTLTNPAVTAHQEAYVRKVIDTVNDLDNVLYEIANEDTGTADDIAWQYHMIRYIKQNEATKPNQHPVGMTACWPEGDDATLLASPADWISPAAKLPLGDGRKVILNDTDHSYFWIGLKADGPAAQRAWVWENFTRGNQCLFMDPYLDPSHDPGRNHPTLDHPDSYWDTLRQAMGHTLSCAERMNLASMRPHGELASSGFCLADPGREYLVYLPQGGEITVDLGAASGQMTVEWLCAAEGTLTHAEPVLGGSQRTLTTPFDGDAVLHLRSK
jgi:hypothetical protein